MPDNHQHNCEPSETVKFRVMTKTERGRHGASLLDNVSILLLIFRRYPLSRGNALGQLERILLAQCRQPEQNAR